MGPGTLRGQAPILGVLVDGQRKDVLAVRGDMIESPVYSPTGHILYHRETTNPRIWAVPFSLERLETTGSPFLVAPQGSYPSMSANGTLIYADSSVSGVTALSWLDLQSGKLEPVFKEHFPTISFPRLSPDGKRVVFLALAPGTGQLVVVGDLQRGTHVRLSNRADLWSRPTWRDDQTVVFSRSGGQTGQIVMRAADGSGGETLVTTGVQPYIAANRMLFTRVQPDTGGNLFDLPLPAAGQKFAEPQLLQALPEHEAEPRLSSDETLLTYTKGGRGSD